MFIDPPKIPEKENRKQGGVLDSLGGVYRGIQKMIFGTGTTMQDRPGARKQSDVDNPLIYTLAKSVFEVFQNKESDASGINMMYLGRSGLGFFKNTNYIELAANKIDDFSGLGNGTILLFMRQNGEDTNSQISLFDLDQFSPGTDGINAVMSSEKAGGCGLYHYDNSGNIDRAFYVGADGIVLQGLPTSAPAGSNLLWKDVDGTLKIT